MEATELKKVTKAQLVEQLEEMKARYAELADRAESPVKAEIRSHEPSKKYARTVENVHDVIVHINGAAIKVRYADEEGTIRLDRECLSVYNEDKLVEHLKTRETNDEPFTVELDVWKARRRVRRSSPKPQRVR